MILGITSDHGGFELKQKIIKHFEKKIKIIDFGTTKKESVDYPDYAYEIGKAIKNKEIDYGIAICKTGIGMSIALNKIKGVYCAKIDDANEVKLSKEHNGINAISLSGKISFLKAIKIINILLSESKPLEERHQKRINKIKEFENEY